MRTTRIRVIITTCDRPDMLVELVHDLDRNRHLFNVTHPDRPVELHLCIYDDGVQSRVPRELVSRPDVSYVRTPEHYGKRDYWYLWHQIFQHARGDRSWTYCWTLPDDVRLHENVLGYVWGLWGALPSDRICLNTLLDAARQGKACWTDYEPVALEIWRGGEHLYAPHDRLKVWRTQWMDLCVWCERAMFEVLDWRVEPVNPGRFMVNPLASSGVGRQLSRRLHASAHGLYQVAEPCVLHGDHSSRMHPLRRMAEPLVVPLILDPEIE